MDGGLSPGRSVRVEYRKYPDILHWHFDTRVLGEDDHGVWMALDSGAWIRRGTEPTQYQPDLSVFVAPRQAWWSAIFNRTGSALLYVDINTPPEWDDEVVRMVDLDLDIAVRRAAPSVTELLDEDEFELHRIAFDYPDRLVDQARTTAADLFLRVDRRDEPFRSVAATWMERAAQEYT